MMSDKTELLEFPCEFKVKIIGNNSDLFLQEVISITAKHFPDHQEDSLVKNYSKNNKFLSLTVTVYVLNKEALDHYYRELSSHPEVQWVL